MLSIYYHYSEDKDMRLMKMSLIYDQKIIFKCEVITIEIFVSYTFLLKFD